MTEFLSENLIFSHHLTFVNAIHVQTYFTDISSSPNEVAFSSVAVIKIFRKMEKVK